MHANGARANTCIVQPPQAKPLRKGTHFARSEGGMLDSSASRIWERLYLCRYVGVCVGGVVHCAGWPVICTLKPAARLRAEVDASWKEVGP